ncbi:MAG: radical SAM protein [Christensenellaceae bacterium]|jgi:radical SAM protein with 4Fe4S-binding SPASM domain|nr:radical SAM protein [Christensenellaceae bacterium]
MLKELDLHITNRCTSSCLYCCFESNRLKLNEFSYSQICKILKEANGLGCTDVHITGGEPLIREDILDIVAFANSLDFHIRMQTNGSLLSKKMAIALYDAGLKSIMISLDSFNQETHEKMRGQGTFLSTLLAIRIALEAKLNVRINSVLTKVNKSEIFDTIEFVRKLGIKNYSAFYFSPIGSGRSISNEWIPPEEYLQFWNGLQKLIKNSYNLHDMNIIIEKGYANWVEAKKIDVSNFTGCGGGCLNTYNNKDYIIIRCDGNMYPCIMALEHSPLGNINLNSLSNIYANSEIWETLTLTGASECGICQNKIICGEGCRYYPHLINKSSEHDDRCIVNRVVPLCPIMKYNSLNNSLGGSSDDVMVENEENKYDK